MDNQDQMKGHAPTASFPNPERSVASGGSAPQATQAPNGPLIRVEVRPAGDMGNGLFAAQDIPEGTRILAEVPLLVTPPKHPGKDSKPIGEKIADFCGAARGLPPQKLKEMEELHYNPAFNKRANHELFETFFRIQGFTDAQGNPLYGMDAWDAVQRMAKLYAIFENNAFEPSEWEARESQWKYDAGLFPWYSRINHSCSPNACEYYNPTIERFTVHAFRHIKAGEQIFVDYIRNASLTRQMRQKELIKERQFVCHCSTCANGTAESLRQRMYDLDQAVVEFEESHDRDAESWRARVALRQAWSQAAELAYLLRHPDVNIQNMNLCIAYQRCSQFCQELGYFEKAIEYTQKDLEVERRLIGSDTDHLRHDTNSAQCRLQHLQSLLDLPTEPSPEPSPEPSEGPEDS